MIFKKKRPFFNSLRVLYQQENLKELLDKTIYDDITVVSYEPLPLERGGFGMMRKELANIRLNGSIDEIAGRFARRTRQEIARTDNISGLEFKVDDPDKENTYALYADFERAQGRKPWKSDSFSGVINFNAYFNGELIAAVPCYDLFPYLQVRAIASKRLGVGEENKELYKLIGSATRRLIFEICKYGKEKGYGFVGLGSVNYSTPQKANVARFKLFFGTEPGKEYTYIYKSRRLMAVLKVRNFLRPKKDREK